MAATLLNQTPTLGMQLLVSAVYFLWGWEVQGEPASDINSSMVWC